MKKIYNINDGDVPYQKLKKKKKNRRKTKKGEENGRGMEEERVNMMLQLRRD